MFTISIFIVACEPVVSALVNVAFKGRGNVLGQESIPTWSNDSKNVFKNQILFIVNNLLKKAKVSF